MVHQGVLFEKIAEQMTRQAKQVTNAIHRYRRQVEQYTCLCMDQALESVEAVHKLSKEGTAAVNRATADYADTLRANLQEAARMFGPVARA